MKKGYIVLRGTAATGSDRDAWNPLKTHGRGPDIRSVPAGDVADLRANIEDLDQDELQDAYDDPR